MLTAGANGVVNPTAIGGLRLVSELGAPGDGQFFGHHAARPGDRALWELVVDESSALLGKTLAEADLRRSGDVLIVAARQPNAEHFTYNPSASFVLQAGCVVVVLGPVVEIDKLRALCAAGQVLE